MCMYGCLLKSVELSYKICRHISTQEPHKAIFAKWEWDMAKLATSNSWQFWGLHGNSGVHGSSEVYMTLTERLPCRPCNCHNDPNNYTRRPRYSPSHGNSLMWLLLDGFMCRYNSSIKLQYRKGTSIQQVPVFRHLCALRKSPWKFYHLDEWIIITLHVAGFLHPAIFYYFHHSSDKSGLKVTDCTVQSAEYCCFHGVIIFCFNLIIHVAMCIELATQKGWRRYAFACFISFILRYLSQTERYNHVLGLIWKLI